ncbi:MAG: hypothetical protein GY856_50645, partial [bacterium]|nr:hypothetical protein [bacterium]
MRTLRSSRSSWTTRPDPNSEILRWIRELQGGIAVDTNSRRLFKRYYGWVLGFIERRGFSP